MQKVRVLMLALAVLASVGVSACTPKQKADFICKVKYGNEAHAVIEKNGDAGCYRLAGGIHASCQEDMPCWNCKTMGNHVCGHR